MCPFLPEKSKNRESFPKPILLIPSGNEESFLPHSLSFFSSDGCLQRSLHQVGLFKHYQLSFSVTPVTPVIPVKVAIPVTPVIPVNSPPPSPSFRLSDYDDHFLQEKSKTQSGPERHLRPLGPIIYLLDHPKSLSGRPGSFWVQPDPSGVSNRCKTH